MRIRFWGTQSLGLVGSPWGKHVLVEVVLDGTLIIRDCGAGRSPILAEASWRRASPIRIIPAYSHALGPHPGVFFAPLFIPGNEWDEHAPLGLGQRLEIPCRADGAQVFPVTLGQLDATIRHHELSEGAFDLGC
jgi:hypothetical protein